MTDKLKQAIEALLEKWREKRSRLPAMTNAHYLVSQFCSDLATLQSAAPERVEDGLRMDLSRIVDKWDMSLPRGEQVLTASLNRLKGMLDKVPAPQTVSMGEYRLVSLKLIERAMDLCDGYTAEPGESTVFDELKAIAFRPPVQSVPSVDGLQASSDGAVTVNGKRWGQWPDTAHRVTAYDAAKEYADPQNSILVPVCSYSAALQDRNSLIRAIHAHLLSRQPQPRTEEVRELLNEIIGIRSALVDLNNHGMTEKEATDTIMWRCDNMSAALAKLEKGSE